MPPPPEARVIRPAILVLEDGSVFRGRSIGAETVSVGEVVFNTAMTGYQEILTDPSYARQIVTLTYPHIGNTGVNAEDEESERIWAAGLVIRDLPLRASNFRMQQSLDAYLEERGVAAIAEIDTRRLTRLLRDKGALNGCLMATSEIDEDDALAQARGFAGLKGMDLAKEVSTKASYRWGAGIWRLGRGHPDPAADEPRFRVVAYDFGVKRNILRMLAERGCDLTVVPAQTAARDVLSMQPDGVFLSNGPGDPEPCSYAIAAIRELLDAKLPIFGICLGHQILARAFGAQTYRMKFGHHGGNHPVLDRTTERVEITSQNHSFAVDLDSLPDSVECTHHNLNDNTVEGLRHRELPIFSVQFHP
ncbi:MAG: glutamine-hydrolyzing carbamoyl-phosphate synthase small subunit, partial [Pseudomonadota bacterium]